jgi:hypothetical protein
MNIYQTIHHEPATFLFSAAATPPLSINLLAAHHRRNAVRAGGSSHSRWPMRTCLASGGVAGCVGGGRGRAMALDTASGGWGKGVRREFRVRSDPPYLGPDARSHQTNGRTHGVRHVSSRNRMLTYTCDHRASSVNNYMVDVKSYAPHTSLSGYISTHMTHKLAIHGIFNHNW